MKKNQFKILYENQFKHWWYCGRRQIIGSIIKKFKINLKSLLICDLGCGFGANSNFYNNSNLDPYLLELNSDALLSLKEQGYKNVIKWKSPAPLDKKFDFIFLTDVLEHIEDDKGCINWVSDHLHKNGHVLLTCPAKNYLWTKMDDDVHHFRRYDLNELEKLFLGNENFEVLYKSYYNFFLFPLKLISLIVDRTFKSRTSTLHSKIPNRFINYILFNIMNFESFLIRYGINFPIGVSVILLIRKRY